MKIKLFILSVLCSFPLCYDGAGVVGAEWLRIETGIRAVGMSGAQTAAGRGISSLSYNPANLGYILEEETFFNKTNYIVGISHSNFGYAKRLNLTDVVGVNIFFLDSGWIDETREGQDENEPGELGQFKVYNFAAQAAYAKMLTDHLKVGVTLKYIREDIEYMYMQGLAFDVGANYDLGFLGFVVGISLNNFGPDVKFEGKGLEEAVDSDYSPVETLVNTTESFSLPTDFRLGIESQLMSSDKRAFITNDLLTLLVAADLIKPMEDNFYLSMGAELGWFNMAFARGGIHIGEDYDAGLSGGLGLKYKGIEIDYSISQYEKLGLTGQFGISLKF